MAASDDCSSRSAVVSSSPAAKNANSLLQTTTGVILRAPDVFNLPNYQEHLVAKHGRSMIHWRNRTATLLPASFLHARLRASNMMLVKGGQRDCSVALLIGSKLSTAEVNMTVCYPGDAGTAQTTKQSSRSGKICPADPTRSGMPYRESLCSEQYYYELSLGRRVPLQC